MVNLSKLIATNANGGKQDINFSGWGKGSLKTSPLVLEKDCKGSGKNSKQSVRDEAKTFGSSTDNDGEDDVLAQIQKKKQIKELNHNFSKSLLNAELLSLSPPVKPLTSQSQRSSEIPFSALRLQRAASLVTDTHLTRVYDMKSEFTRKLSISLLHSLTRLRRTTEISTNRMDIEHLFETNLLQLSHVLRGCDIYVGVLQPGGDYLRYDFVGGKSTVKGTRMHRSDGVSFRCVDEGGIVRAEKIKEKPKTAKSNATSRRSGRSGRSDRSGRGGRSALSTEKTSEGFDATGNPASPTSTSRLTTAALETRPNHVVTTAGQVRVLGRDRSLPYVSVPLLSKSTCSLGVLSCDSFYVGQDISEDSRRLLDFKERWAPFLTRDDEKIRSVKVWRHPKSRVPRTPSPKTRKKREDEKKKEEEKKNASLDGFKPQQRKSMVEKTTAKHIKQPSLETTSTLSVATQNTSASILEEFNLVPEVGACMIRGTIVEVSREKNGLPRKEGPVFTIEWDDNFREEDVGLEEMRKLVESDPKELGACADLTDEVMEYLKEVGKLLGSSMDRIRKTLALERLRDLTKNPTATTLDVLKCAHEVITENVLMAQKIEFWEVEKGQKIFSTVKFDLEGNIKVASSPRYLRHLNDIQTKLFHDYLDCNYSHIDKGEGVMRRKTDFVLDRTTQRDGGNDARDSANCASDDKSNTTNAAVTFVPLPEQHHSSKEHQLQLMHHKVNSAPSILSHPEGKKQKKKTLQELQADFDNMNFDGENENTVSAGDSENRKSVDDKEDLYRNNHATPMQAFEMPDNEYTMVAPFFDVGFTVGKEEESCVRVGAKANSKFCVVVTRQKHIKWKEDLDFLEEVAREVGILNECVRYREKRAEERRQSLQRVEVLCKRWKRVLPLNLMQWTVDELQSCLPSSDIYVSMLERGGDEAVVKVTTPDSKMIGRMINPYRGLTFQCLDSTKIVQFDKPEIKVQPETLEVGMKVEVRYGKLYFSGVITKNCGFNQYDVLYDETNRREVGVQKERIVVVWPEVDRPYNFPDNDRKNGWPFLAMPLSYGNCVVGFCGVDGFESVPKGRDDEPQPEFGIREYISTATKMLGKALFEQRMAEVLNEFSTLSKAFNLTPETIIKTVTESITKHVLFSLSIDIYEIHPELSEEQRSLRRSLKMSRTERKSLEGGSKKQRNRRSLTKTMAVAAALESSLIQARLEAKKKAPEKEEEERKRAARKLIGMNTAAASSTRTMTASSTNDEGGGEQKPQIGLIRKRAGWGGTTLMEYSLKDGPPISRTEMLPEVFDAINQTFKKPSAAVIEKYPEYIVANFRDTNLDDKKKKKGVRASVIGAVKSGVNAIKGEKSEDETPFYSVVVRRKPHALWPEDLEFIEKLVALAQETFTCVRGREYRMKARKTALENINHLCKKWAVTEVRDLIQNSVNELIVPLDKCDVYMGVLEPGGHVINYQGASPESCMADKRLKRGKGVSFRAIDTGKMILVRNEESARAMNVHAFVDLRLQGWPYLCLPLKNKNLVRGILAVDSFDNAGKGRSDEEHPEKFVPEFLTMVGELIGKAIDNKIKKESLTNLENVTKSYYATVEDVYSAALEALRANITFAQQIDILQLTGCTPLPYGGISKEPIDLQSTPRVVLEVVCANGLAKADTLGASDPFCEIVFNGALLGRTCTRENTLDPFWSNEVFDLDFNERCADVGEGVDTAVCENNIDKCNQLIIRIFDEDNNEKSDFLGQVVLDQVALSNLKNNTIYVLDMITDPGLSRERNTLVQGKISIKFTAAIGNGEESDLSDEEAAKEEELLRGENLANVDSEVMVHSAAKLAKADLFGSSDPVAIVKFNKKEIGRTKVIDDNCDPEWKQKFPVTIPNHLKKKDLTIEIFDMDTGKIGAFLGMATMSAKELIYPHPHPQVLELQRNPVLGKKKNNLVQGSVKVIVSRIYSKQSARRWQMLRKHVKVAARKACKHALLRDPDDVEKIVKLGMLCAHDSNSNVQMIRCAAVLLSIAAKKGHKGSGAFWKALASTHLRTWLSEGLRSERLHLEKSSDAMDEALKFMENATNVEVWVQAAYVNQLLGKNERAAQTLGTIIRNFQSYHGIARINLAAAVLLMQLKRFDQACAYMFQCMQHGGSEPYSMTDLHFFMSRFHDNWARVEADDSKAEIAQQGYAQVHAQKLESGEIAIGDKDEWLKDPLTWREYGDKCCVGGHFNLSVDLYSEALEKDPSRTPQNAKFHFGLAKAYYRCGKVGKAIKKIKDAINMSDDNPQMIATLDAWKNPTPHFAEDIALTVEDLLGVYLDGKPHPSHLVKRRDYKLLSPAGTKVTQSGRKLTIPQRVTPLIVLEKQPSIKEKNAGKWLVLRRKIKESARQYFKMKIHQSLVYKKSKEIDAGGGKRKTITSMTATLGCLCYESSPTAKPVLLRACAILLQKAYNRWEADEVGVVFPYYKRLSQALFRTWLNDGLLAEKKMLELSLDACSRGLKSSIASATDYEVWLQLARTQQYLGLNPAAIVTLRLIQQRFCRNDIKLLATTQLQLAMVYKMMKKYSKACSHINECIGKAKLGLLVYTEVELEFLRAHLYEEWQEEDSTKAVIAQMGYQNCLEKLQEAGEEDYNETVNDWLTNGATWQKYAQRCERAGHFGFAVDLFKSAFNRCKASMREPTMWFGLSNSLYHVGKMFDAVVAMETALSIEAEVANDNGGEKTRAVYEEVLRKWKREDVKVTFEMEVNANLETIMDTYLKIDEGGERELAVERLKIEMEGKVRPHIMKIKGNIKRISREHYAETMIAEMNRGSASHIAKMGMLCFNEHTNDIRLMKCSCLLMQKALDFDKRFSGGARFFRHLAISHLRVWQMSGCAAERIHLVYAAKYFDKALVHMENAVKAENWEYYVKTQLFLGKREKAAMILGHMVKHFSSHPRIGVYYLRATAVLMKLGMWEQAAAYAKAAMDYLLASDNEEVDYAEEKKIGVFGRTDLMFVMARIMCLWGVKLKAEGLKMMNAAVKDGSDENMAAAGKLDSKGADKLSLATSAYARIFEVRFGERRNEGADDDVPTYSRSRRARSDNYDGHVGSSFHGNLDDFGYKNSSEWIEAPKTWINYAEMASTEGINLIAANFYKQAIDLSPKEDTSISRGRLYLAYAKCLKKTGDDDGYSSYSQKAIVCGITPPNMPIPHLISHEIIKRQKAREFAENPWAAVIKSESLQKMDLSSEAVNIEEMMEEEKKESEKLAQEKDKEKIASGMAIKRRKTFQRYLKMKSMGMPTDEVKSYMVSDGLDPTLLDRDNDSDGLVHPVTIFEREMELPVVDIIRDIGGINFDSMKGSKLASVLNLAAEEADAEEAREEARETKDGDGNEDGNEDSVLISEAEKSVDDRGLRKDSVTLGLLLNAGEEEGNEKGLGKDTRKDSVTLGLLLKAGEEGTNNIIVKNTDDVATIDDGGIHIMMSALHINNKSSKNVVHVDEVSLTRESASCFEELFRDYGGVSPEEKVAENGIALTADAIDDNAVDSNKNTHAAETDDATAATADALEETSLDNNFHNTSSKADSDRPKVETAHIWRTLRENIKAAAREYYRDQLSEDPRNIEMIVRMGYLCVDSATSCSVGTTRAAAVLLQRAANYGYEGDGAFWSTLANQHLKAYKQGGLRSERAFLVKARSAWDVALNHVEVATKIENHVAYAETALYLGNIDRALQAYESIMKNFPASKHVSTCRMKAAMLRSTKNEHKECINYLHEAIKLKEHSPYTKSQVMMIISQVHGHWGELLNDKFQRKLSKETYDRAYEICETKEQTKNSKSYFDQPGVWLDVAVKATTVDHVIFASEFYSIAAEKHEVVVKNQKKSISSKINEENDAKNRKMSSKIYFGLAKSLVKGGQLGQAIEAIREALRYEPANEQLLTTLDAWENPLQRLENDMTSPVETLLDQYLKSSLRDLMNLPTSTPLRREVTLEIVGCKGLGKADLFGSSDPYCIVSFLGKEIHRTAVVKDDLNPTFVDERVSFILPQNLAGCNLVVEIFDHDKVGKGSFLGMVTVNASTLLEAPPPLDSVELALESNSELDKKGNKLVKGSVVLKWAVYNSVYEGEGNGKDGILRGEGDEMVAVVRSTPRSVIRLSILSCKSLGQADKFGLSDPFVVVKWMGEEVGRTSVIQDCLNPKWERERFCLTLPEFVSEYVGGDKEKEIGNGARTRGDVNLTLEVWDHDVVGVGDFLGQVVFDGEFYYHPPPAARSYSLARKSGMPSDEQKLVQGSIKVKLSLDGGDFGNLTEGVDEDGVRVVKVVLIAAYNLKRECDSYVVVKFGADEIGRSKVIKKSTDPKWNVSNERKSTVGADSDGGLANHNEFLITIIDEDHKGGREEVLLLELYEKVRLGSDKFLGAVVVDGTNVAYPTGKKLESVLGLGLAIKVEGEEEGKKETIMEMDFEDENSKAKRMKDIQGTLAYKILTVEDRASKSLNTAGKNDGGNKKAELWSIMGGQHRDEKFDISKSLNRIQLSPAQIDQMLYSRAKGRRGFTLHGSPETILAPFFDVGTLVNNRKQIGPEMGTLYSLHVQRMPGYDWGEDVTFCKIVANEVEKSLRCIRGRQVRAASRKFALVTVKKVCSDWANSDIHLLMKSVLGVLEKSLPSTNLYFGLLQPGGRVIRYVMSSKNSSMTGKELSRGNGLSFCVIGKGREGSFMYEETTEEDRRKLQHSMSLGGRSEKKLKEKLHAMKNPPVILGNRFAHSYPFVCTALKNDDCCVGVIGCDSFGDVGRGRSDDKVPEEGVVELLEAAGRELGASIDKKRKLTALSKFEEIVDDVFVTAQDVYMEALKIIANNVLTSFAAEIWHLDESNWGLQCLRSISCDSVGGIGAIYDEGLVLNIEDAVNLGKADTFGASDPFCKVFWNGSFLGKTKVCDNTCNPVWTNETFTLSPPNRGQSMELRIEVYDADFGGEGDFLGQVILNEKILLRPPLKSINPKLVIKEGCSKKVNRLVQGRLGISLGPAGGDDGFKLVEFCILDCQGLSKADFFGLSDPIILVKWNGIEVARTTVKEDTLDPVYREFFQVKVSDSFDEKDELSLEVYDMDMMGIGDFLGRVGWGGEQAVGLEGRVEAELTIKDTLTTKQNKLVGGRIRVVFGSEDEVVERHFRNIVIEGCEGLAKADLLGKSDPFVVVKYDGMEIFRTKSVKNTLDPSWLEGNRCVVGLTDVIYEDRFLELNVYDEDFGGAGSEDFLGGVRISCEDLRENVFGNKRATMDLQDEEVGVGEGEEGSLTDGSTASGWFSKGSSKKSKLEITGSITFRVKNVGKDGEDLKLPEGYGGDDTSRERFSVRVCCKQASNLAKADTFGASDPYCIVTFGGRAVGKTAVVRRTLNPVWNDSKFIINVPFDCREEEDLVVKVYDNDLVGSHDFMGMVTVKGRDIVTARDSVDPASEADNVVADKDDISGDVQSPASSSKLKLNLDGGEFYTVPLLPDTTLSQKNSLVKGDLEFGLEILSEGISAEGKVAGVLGGAGGQELKEGEPVCRVNIIRARSLAKADRFGKSDPFVVVRVKGDAWYEGSVVDNDLDPVFYNERCVVPLGDGDDKIKHENNKGAAISVTSDNVDDADNDDDDDDDEDKGIEHLILEVWDSDGIMGRSFLGRVGVSSSSLHDLSFYHTVHELKLGPCPSLPLKENEKAGGTVSVLFTPTTFLAESRPRPRVTLHIIEAFGLAKADSFGKSDPFCVLKLNGKTMGKTKVCNNTMEPIWDESFLVDVPRDDDDLHFLTVECYDADGFTKGDFLGMLVFQAQDIRKWRQTRGKVILELRKNPELKNSMNKLVQGHIVVAITDIEGEIYDDDDTPARREKLHDNVVTEDKEEEDPLVVLPPTSLQIMSASQLLKADMLGLSDPFCVVRWGGVILGRTATRSDTLDPVWNDEFFSICFEGALGVGGSAAAGNLDVDDGADTASGRRRGEAEGGGMTLSIEVWDEDLGGIRGDFLGCVELGCSTLLHPPSGPLTLPLVNRFGWPNDKKRGMAVITGTIKINLVHTYTRARIPMVPPPAGERTIFNEDFKGTPITIAKSVRSDTERYEKEDLYRYTNVSKLIKKGERLEDAALPSGLDSAAGEDPIDIDFSESSTQPPIVDGRQVLSEVGAGQMIGAWLRKIKFCMVPGNPDRLFMPFHDFFAVDGGDEDKEAEDSDSGSDIFDDPEADSEGNMALAMDRKERGYSGRNSIVAEKYRSKARTSEAVTTGLEGTEIPVPDLKRAKKVARARATFAFPGQAEAVDLIAPPIGGSADIMHNKYAVVVNCRRNLIAPSDETFCKQVSDQMEQSLTIVRQREDRVRRRKESLKRLRLACKAWRLLDSTKSLLDFVVGEVADTLKGCEVYVSVMQPGGEIMKIIATNDEMVMGGTVDRSAAPSPGADSRVVVTGSSSGEGESGNTVTDDYSTSSDSNSSVLFDVFDKGSFYFCIGDTVRKGHASWSSKIAQIDFPVDPDVSCLTASVCCDDHRSKVLSRSEATEKDGANAPPLTPSSKGKKRNYWRVLRSKIKVGARNYAVIRLRSDPSNVDFLAYLGLLFVDSGPRATYRTHRTAAMLMQKAWDCGFGEETSAPPPNAGITKDKATINAQKTTPRGKLFYSLASAHLRTYVSGGLKSERIHLRLSVAAWKKALTFLENSVKVDAWEQFARAQQYLGDYKGANVALGQIALNFPKYAGLKKVLFKRAILLKKLKRYEMAAGLMNDVIMRPDVDAKGSSQRYTQGEYKFALGSLLHAWGTSTRSNERMELSKKYLSEAYAFSGSKLPREKWLSSWETWSEFAERCTVMGDDLLASDSLSRSLELASRLDPPPKRSALSRLHFSLAKSQMRSGEDEHAKNSLDVASQLNPTSGQIQAFVDAWLSRESYLESDLSLDVLGILDSIPEEEISVFGVSSDENDGPDLTKTATGDLESDRFVSLVSGQIVSPLWGFGTATGVIGVKNLSAYKIFSLARGGRQKNAPDETQLQKEGKRGLEEGIVNYVKDVGLLAGLAYAKLRRTEILRNFKREVKGMSKKEMKHDHAGIRLMERSCSLIRLGCLNVKSVSVLQILRNKWGAEEKKERKEWEKKYSVDTNVPPDYVANWDSDSDSDESLGDSTWEDLDNDPLPREEKGEDKEGGEDDNKRKKAKNRPIGVLKLKESIVVRKLAYVTDSIEPCTRTSATGGEFWGCEEPSPASSSSPSNPSDPSPSLPPLASQPSTMPPDVVHWSSSLLDHFHQCYSTCVQRREQLKSWRTIDGIYVLPYRDPGHLDNLKKRWHCVFIRGKINKEGGQDGTLSDRDVQFCEDIVSVFEEGIRKIRVHQNGGEMAEKLRKEAKERERERRREEREMKENKKRGTSLFTRRASVSAGGNGGIFGKVIGGCVTAIIHGGNAMSAAGNPMSRKSIKDAAAIKDVEEKNTESSEEAEDLQNKTPDEFQQNVEESKEEETEGVKEEAKDQIKHDEAKE